VIRTLGSLLFYARFLRSFSAIAYRRRARNWPDFNPDYSGQTWLVTGATGGIARSVALTAVSYGATVIAVGRSTTKLEALCADANDDGRLIPLRADLSELVDVANLPNHEAISERSIDVLVNSVGVLLNKFETTSEDFERSFATNLLGHWVLTESLLAEKRLACDGLVIEVSSGGMYGSALKLEPMDCRRPDDYDGMVAYAMHKRAQVELTHHWNQRWQGGPIAHVMHPGWVDTEGVKNALPVFRSALKTILRNPAQGADTIHWLVDEYPEAVGEGIWLDRELHPEHEFKFTRHSSFDANALGNFLKRTAGRVLQP